MSNITAVRPSIKRLDITRFATHAAISIALFIGASAINGNAHAQTHIHLQLNTPQPSIPYYVAPRQAPHRVQWVPGHWVHTGHHHRKVWVEGHWAPKQRYSSARYQRRHWDRDDDGVANRYDRRPDNPRKW